MPLNVLSQQVVQWQGGVRPQLQTRPIVCRQNASRARALLTLGTGDSVKPHMQRVQDARRFHIGNVPTKDHVQNSRESAHYIRAGVRGLTLKISREHEMDDWHTVRISPAGSLCWAARQLPGR